MGCEPHLRNISRDISPPLLSDRLACSQHPWQTSDLPLLKEIPWLPKEAISTFYCSQRQNIFPHIQPKSSLWQIKQITACPDHCGHKTDWSLSYPRDPLNWLKAAIITLLHLLFFSPRGLKNLILSS